MKDEWCIRTSVPIVLFKYDWIQKRWVFDTLEGKVVPDKWRSHDPMHKMSKETALATVNHIESYQPALCHSRRAHTT